MTDTYGDELRDKLIPIFDQLAEDRCCEHGINNGVKANEKALAAMQTIINEEWREAVEAHDFIKARS